jgi:hypothetical protein
VFRSCAPATTTMEQIKPNMHIAAKYNERDDLDVLTNPADLTRYEFYEADRVLF